MKTLIALAAVQAAFYGAIAWVSGAFDYGTNEQARPILLVLALLMVNFLLYLFAIRVAIRREASSRLGWAIIAPAILFRCLLLPTPPIQEIDIYRYLWDGAVTAHGMNPYRYSPAQVVAADSRHTSSHELHALARLRDSSSELSKALRRIHYAGLTTAYPPTSQAIFAVGALLTPGNASVHTRVFVLKALLTTFDIGTITLVWLLLKMAGKHPGWIVAYAWCPLVIKEIANSGHLDSIAVFLTTAAVVCVVHQFEAGKKRPGIFWLIAAAALLALAIGAKLYAVVLIPLLGAAIAARGRVSASVCFVSLSLLLSAICLAPLLRTTTADEIVTQPRQLESDRPVDANAQIANAKPDATGPGAASGLRTFLEGWEMNDFLFMLIVENVRPVEQSSTAADAWFSIAPNQWRGLLTAPLATAMEVNAGTAAFVLTRMLTGCVFLIIGGALAWHVYRHATVHSIVVATFLTLAWFWLLLPTQNPWYWLWALPFLPFACGRAWYAVSGLVLIYYLRFWLQYHYADGPTAGTAYTGAQYFDFVVTWLEYAPWFAWLAIASLRQHREEPRSQVPIQRCVGGFTEIKDGTT